MGRVSVRRVLHQSASVEFKKISVFGLKFFIGHLTLTMVTAQTLIFIIFGNCKKPVLSKVFHNYKSI